MAGDQLFGSILSLSNVSGTIVFVSVMIFLTFFEAALHHLEKIGGKRGYKALIMKLYREFMILGFISFSIQVLSTVTSLPKNDKWYAAFQFAKIVILFVGIAFLLQSFLLIVLISQRNKRLLYYDSCTSESLFFEYIQLHDNTNHKNSQLYQFLNPIMQYLFNYGPVSIPIPELREKIEFKIIQEYFIRSYQLDPKFKFANYMCKVLKNYIISLIDVRPVNWFRLAFLVVLNYIRIYIFDPLYETNICESNPSDPEYVHGRSESYAKNVCPEYQLRVIFIGVILMTIYLTIVFIVSEIYIQRLIGKVLDDEETLQWLDTEEAHAEETYQSNSAFPHPFELLNPNETLFRKNSLTGLFPAVETAKDKEDGGTANSGAVPALLDLPPIVPAVGKVPRFGSASEAANVEEIATKQFRRSSIRRSLSYKSPLNDKDIAEVVSSLEPVHESPIPAPPKRGVGVRRQSITIQVPIHRDSMPTEMSRGSLMSMEDGGNTKALTTDVNSFNRRHLYLKCLERIIHVEYSYHETEARRTSITSESEAYGIGHNHHHHHNSHHNHHNAPPAERSLPRPNSGRLRSNTISALPAGNRSSTGTTSGSVPMEHLNGLDRIQQLKGLNMKALRELMMKSKSVAAESLGEGLDSPTPNGGLLSPGTHSRQNSAGSGILKRFRSRGSASSTANSSVGGGGGGVRSPSPPSKPVTTGTTSLAGLFDPVSPLPRSNSSDRVQNEKSSGFNFYSVLPSSSKKHGTGRQGSVESRQNNIELTKVVKKDSTASVNTTSNTNTTGEGKTSQESKSEEHEHRQPFKKEFTSKFFEFEAVDPDAPAKQSLFQRLNAYRTDPTISRAEIILDGFQDCCTYVLTKLWQIIYSILSLILYGSMHTHEETSHHQLQQHGDEEGEHGIKPSNTLQEIKELENDLKAIFAWNSPDIYYTTVEFSLLLQCMYIALWSTNFVILALESNHVILWEFALVIPMLFNFFVLKQVLFISCMLQSIIKIDTTIANKISEEAIEERSVKERLRRMIRDQLKNNTLEKRQWKNLLYSYYSKVMDENEEITVHEWKEFLYSLNLQLTNNSIKRIFKVIDQDQDGFIHWNDLYMIIFPDFMKKKVKIRRKKGGKKHHRHRSKSSAANHDDGEDGGGDEAKDDRKQFSMEYHISEEDRLSYKKKTMGGRGSVLAASMKMIRNSLVPTTSPTATSLLDRQSSNASGSSPRDKASPPGSPPRAESERKEIQLNIGDREYKDSRESSTQSKPKSILKKTQSDEPRESLELDMANIYAGNEATMYEEELQTYQNSIPKTAQQQHHHQPARKSAVSFDEDRVPPPRSASPLPASSDHSLSPVGYFRSEEEEELEAMRERSRSFARQRSLSYRPPVHSPGSSLGGSMMSGLKKTFSKHLTSKKEENDDEEDEDDDEDDLRGGKFGGGNHFHRFHSVNSRIEEKDDLEEDDEEEDDEVDDDDQSNSNVDSDASDISDISQTTNEIDEQADEGRGDQVRRSIRNSLTTAQRRALLNTEHGEEDGTPEYTAETSEGRMERADSYYDI